MQWLGSALDIGGLNHAIDVANDTIREADNNLRENENLVRQAQERLSKLGRHTGDIDRLCSKMNNFDPTIHRQLKDVNALHRKLGDLTPKILAASQFAGSLAAKSSTLPYNFSAASFASKIVDLEGEMNLNTGIRSTLLARQPHQLEGTLKAIAQSDADLGDIM